MQFKKYSSLENHYNQKTVDHVIMMGLTKPDVVWTAREKIHGANYAYYFDGTDFRFAKRSSFVDKFSNFFAHHEIADVHEELITAMYHEMVSVGLIELGNELIVYGEIAGTMSTGRKVQQEVDYGSLNFYAFDIKINGVYMNDLDVELWCNEYQINTAPLLAIGDFNTLFKISNDFDSVVGQTPTKVIIDGENISYDITYTLVYEGKNVAEGFVLKPNVTHYFGNGNRVAIKSKNEKFSEKKKLGKVQKMKNKDIALGETDTKVLERFQEYMTEARLRNVISKFGEVKQCHFSNLLNLMVQDMDEEYESEYGPRIEIDSFSVKKMINSLTSQFIGRHFGAIMGGVF